MLTESLSGQQLKSDTTDVSQTLVMSVPNGLNLPGALEKPLGAAEQNMPRTTVDRPKFDFSPKLASALVKPVPLKSGRRTDIRSPRQMWEGVVVDRDDLTFTARVSDRTNRSNPEEIVQFDLDEISQDDAMLIKPGASFYWSIGTERSPAGTIKNYSLVSFRRLPQWRQSSLDKADKGVKELESLLFKDDAIR